jgi:hypothetical protein
MHAYFFICAYIYRELFLINNNEKKFIFIEGPNMLHLKNLI